MADQDGQYLNGFMAQIILPYTGGGQVGECEKDLLNLGQRPGNADVLVGS